MELGAEGQETIVLELQLQGTKGEMTAKFKSLSSVRLWHLGFV
jgi:hypothetical protein